MKLPLVSVCIPLYNALHYLDDAIQSILDQTYKNVEIVLYDDGSNEAACNYYQEIVNGIEHLRYIRQEQNRGIGFARNRLIEHAQGDYIAFLDSDDRMCPDRLELQVEFLENNPEVDLVGSNYQEFTNKNFGKKSRVQLNHAKILRAFSYMCPLPNPTLMARKKIMQQLGYDELFHSAEDLDFLLRAQKAGLKMANLPYVLTFYRVHSNSLSTSAKFNMQLFTYLAMRKIDLYNMKNAYIECKQEFEKSLYIVFSSARELSRLDQIKCLLVAPFSSIGRFFLKRRFFRFFYG